MPLGWLLLSAFAVLAPVSLAVPTKKQKGHACCTIGYKCQYSQAPNLRPGCNAGATFEADGLVWKIGSVSAPHTDDNTWTISSGGVTFDCECFDYGKWMCHDPDDFKNTLECGKSDAPVTSVPRDAGLALPASSCPGYTEVANMSNPAVAGFKLAEFSGVWYEVYSHNLPVVTSGCSCTRYNVSVGQAGWGTDFSCMKSGKISNLHSDNKLASDPKFPGMLEEAWKLPIGHTPATAYWVLDVGVEAQGQYESSLVYSCTSLLGVKSEWIYLFSRKPDLPDSEVHLWTAYMKGKGIDTTGVSKVPQHSDSCGSAAGPPNGRSILV